MNFILLAFFLLAFSLPARADVTTVRYPNGQVFQEIEITDAGKDWKIYDEKGTLSVRKQFDPEGNLIVEKFYDEKGEPVLNGPWQGRNMYGQLSRTVTLKGGKIDGEDLHYDKDGKVNWRRVYKDGELVGEQTFDKDGNVRFSKGKI